jgi:hypothetical protein
LYCSSRPSSMPSSMPSSRRIPRRCSNHISRYSSSKLNRFSCSRCSSSRWCRCNGWRLPTWSQCQRRHTLETRRRTAGCNRAPRCRRCRVANLWRCAAFRAYCSSKSSNYIHIKIGEIVAETMGRA